MAFVRNLGIAFACGFLATLVFYAALIVADRIDLAGIMGIKPLGVPPLVPAIYLLGTWGGIWALLLAFPWISRLWFIRGIVIGLIATAAAIFIWGRLGGQTFSMLWVYGAVLNVIWGLAAALFYRVVSIDY
jgi:hypothetical protein